MGRFFIMRHFLLCVYVWQTSASKSVIFQSLCHNFSRVDTDAILSLPSSPLQVIQRTGRDIQIDSEFSETSKCFVEILLITVIINFFRLTDLCPRLWMDLINGLLIKSINY